MHKYSSLVRGCFFTALISIVAACTHAPIPPTFSAGSKFPSVIGESLDNEKIRIPEDFSGQATVLLVGYQQKAQFDIDRWILGLLQLQTPAKIVEVPTITGMLPQMVQSFITDGMRSGIPGEDWKAVVTVFEDAGKIAAALGNERPQSSYTVLLDKYGVIRKVYNSGYSAGNVKELDAIVRSLGNIEFPDNNVEPRI